MPSEPLRIGMIGLGRAAGLHMTAYQRFPAQVQLAAVCDLNESLAHDTASRHGLPCAWSEPLRFIAEAPIDAVDICTPQNTHAALAVAAARAGRHVLVEKPMACSPDDCRAMVDAASAAGVVLMVAQNQRYRPQWRAVRSAIGRGEIGAVRAIDMSVVFDVFRSAPESHWVYDRRIAGGGVVMSFAVNMLDLARYLVGDIVRVSAVLRTGDLRLPDGAEDWAAVNLQFAGGAVGQLLAAFSPSPSPWRESVTIWGDSGAIWAAVPPGGSLQPQLATAAAGAFRQLDVSCAELPSEDMFANTIMHFADCCRNGGEPLSGGRDNLRTMQAVFAIYRSAADGRAIDANPTP